MSEETAITKPSSSTSKVASKGDANLMAKSFHADAATYAVTDGQSEGGPIQILFDAVEGSPVPNLTGVIGPIEVNTTTATATVVLFDWSGVDYTDLFTLLKINGS